jgi:dihydrofolate reductase
MIAAGNAVGNRQPKEENGTDRRRRVRLADGKCRGPWRPENFRFGGWTFEFPGEERYGFKTEETMATDALLLGRTTYEGFAQAWPSRDGEFADKFNSMPKYVLSTTIEEPTWQNTTVLRDLDAVRELKESQEGTLAVHGSAQLVQSLLDADLVDELRLMVYPVVLGEGKRLFGPLGDKKVLKLTESRTVDDNVLILIYRR